MAGRTFTIGDIHGETQHLYTLLSRLPVLDAEDTLVFTGDYLDRGPHSKEVIEHVMTLHERTPAKVVCLRGNHEDGWLRVCREGWDEFVLPPEHGCLAALRSFNGLEAPRADERATWKEMAEMTAGSFLPGKVVDWMEALPYWYEDGNAIYVHAGLPRGQDGFLHPSQVPFPSALAWVRTEDFVRNYRGKNVVFGHTPTGLLPQELSEFTPEDPTDMFDGVDVYGVDTGCGNGGFLTALELPAVRVYESR